MKWDERLFRFTGHGRGKAQLPPEFLERVQQRMDALGADGKGSRSIKDFDLTQSADEDGCGLVMIVTTTHGERLEESFALRDLVWTTMH